jgi:hypothetical protein
MGTRTKVFRLDHARVQGNEVSCFPETTSGKVGNQSPYRRKGGELDREGKVGLVCGW